MNVRDTIKLSLNVLEGFTPEPVARPMPRRLPVPRPNDPALQEHVLDQVPSPEVVVADLHDHWIQKHAAGADQTAASESICCPATTKRRACCPANITWLKQAARFSRWVRLPLLIKRGEYGVLQFSDDGMFAVPAYPLEDVVDPTGAGDTFAGGMMGFLARHGRLTESSLRTAVVYGSVMASFVVERFSLERLLDLTWEEIDKRYREFIDLIDSHHSRWTTQ